MNTRCLLLLLGVLALDPLLRLLFLRTRKGWRGREYENKSKGDWRLLGEGCCLKDNYQRSEVERNVFCDQVFSNIVLGPLVHNKCVDIRHEE